MRRREHSSRYKGAQRKGRIRQLIAKHRGLCALCGEPVDLKLETGPRYATVDHILPTSRGGQDIPSNWQLACLECNQRKGDVIGKPATFDDKAAE